MLNEGLNVYSVNLLTKSGFDLINHSWILLEHFTALDNHPEFSFKRQATDADEIQCESPVLRNPPIKPAVADSSRVQADQGPCGQPIQF